MSETASLGLFHLDPGTHTLSSEMARRKDVLLFGVLFFVSSLTAVRSIVLPASHHDGTIDDNAIFKSPSRYSDSPTMKVNCSELLHLFSASAAKTGPTLILSVPAAGSIQPGRFPVHGRDLPQHGQDDREHCQEVRQAEEAAGSRSSPPPPDLLWNESGTGTGGKRPPNCRQEIVALQ